MRGVVAGLMMAVALAVPVLAGAAEPRAVPGTRIALDPPPGSTPAKGAAGYVNRKDRLSIAVVQRPAAAFAADRRNLLDGATWTKRGQLLLETLTLPGFPYEHALVVVQRQERGVLLHVWHLLLAHPELTGLVSVTVAQGGKPGLEPGAAKALLAAVRVLPGAPVKATDEKLPFAVDPPKRFTHRQVQSSRQLLFREAPPPGFPGEAMAMVLVLSDTPVPAIEREQSARRTIYGNKAMDVVTLDPPKPLAVGGLPALEFLAGGKQPDGKEQRLYALMIYGPKRTYAVYAMADPNRFVLALDDIKALARSFRETP